MGCASEFSAANQSETDVILSFAASHYACNTINGNSLLMRSSRLLYYAESQEMSMSNSLMINKDLSIIAANYFTKMISNIIISKWYAL